MNWTATMFNAERNLAPKNPQDRIVKCLIDRL